MTDEEKEAKRRRLQEKALHAGPTHPSMLRRSDYHDYTSRCIYLITVTTQNRLPLLGRLADHEGQARIDLTPLGEEVRKQWVGLPGYYSQLQVIATCVMPDHFHGILFVREPLAVGLGQAVRGFKQGCTKAYRSLCGDPQAMLWEKGFNDRILSEDGQLKRWVDYLRDNPRRLAMKRANPDLFRVTTALPLFGITFSSMGNLFLLRFPVRVQVQCSRSLTPAQIEEETAKKLALAARGAVLVSPSISEGERTIMRAAFDRGYPLIVLMKKGFHQLQKPPGRYFDACAQGRMLWLSPFAYSNRPMPLFREMCLVLNEYARRICEEM